MNADRIAAAIAMIATLLAATGLPGKLGLTPQWVTAIGGAVLACAGIIRGLLAQHDGERIDWRDLLGAALGVVAIGLGVEGAAVDQLDPNMLAGGASFAAMVFAAVRGSGKPPNGPTAGWLLLLVLIGCEHGGAHVIAGVPAAIVASLVIAVLIGVAQGRP